MIMNTKPIARYIILGIFVLLSLIILWHFLRPSCKDYQIISETLSQPVDHQQVSGAHFEQRIKILTPKNVSSDPYVFFILGNESPISDTTIANCYKMYGKRKDMIFILAEHRGYGKSVSPDQDQTVPKYVTVEQALADYHAVAQKYHTVYTGPWIAAGYSYGGGLSINYGYKYPDDADAILSSSGVVDWSYLLDSYEKQAKENLGNDLYNRLVEHINNLTPSKTFDQNWMDRELIYSYISGLSQTKNFNKSFKPVVAIMAHLPTRQFVNSLRLFDSTFARGSGGSYVTSNSKLNLSRDDALSEKYGWRVWHYQQFNETGTLWHSSQKNGLYRNSEEDWAKECSLLFGEEPQFPKKNIWNVKDMVNKLEIPIVYVSGGKDPWKYVCLPKDYKIENGSNLRFEDSFHCPDREQAVGVKVIEEVLKYAAHF